MAMGNSTGNAKYFRDEVALIAIEHPTVEAAENLVLELC
jgi:hypothetical protein